MDLLACDSRARVGEAEADDSHPRLRETRGGLTRSPADRGLALLASRPLTAALGSTVWGLIDVLTYENIVM